MAKSLTWMLGRAGLIRLFIVTLMVLTWTTVNGAQAETLKRIALVIGNSDYEHVSSLTNPANDAVDISKSLTRIGFEVTTGLNLDYNALRITLRDFAEASATADMIVVYFAGHGIEIENTNYLVPVNAALKSDRDVEFEAIRLDAIINAIADAPGVKIVLVDACRNNPFLVQMKRKGATRSATRGLAAIEPGGVMVGYAARGGTLAQDGDGRNSPYATALLEYMEEPGLELGKMFRRIRDRVLQLTDGNQEPFTYGSLPGEDIFLLPKVESVAMVAPELAPQGATVDIDEHANVLAAAMAVNTVRGWDLYAAKYGKSALLNPDIIARIYEMAPKGISGNDRAGAIEDFLALDIAQRKALQIALSDLGADVGEPDGVLGAKTRAVIRAVQADKGLPQTGFVDPVLLASIGFNWRLDYQKGFVSSPLAVRQNSEQLAVLGENPEIVRVLTCLGLRKNIYGTFQGSFYVALLASGSVQSARTEAQKCGVDLAAITTSAENAFVVEMFKKDPAFADTGYDSKTKISYKSGPYFGFRKDPSEENAVVGWRWYSGEAVAYTNWLPSKPNRDHGNGRKQYAQFSFEQRGRVDLQHAVPSKWFDGDGTYAQSFILEGTLP